jgi:hypothetical protein
VVSLTFSSGGYINGRNTANLELLIDKTSSIYLHVKHRLKDNFAQIWKTNINLDKFNNITNRNENKLGT